MVGRSAVAAGFGFLAEGGANEDGDLAKEDDRDDSGPGCK